ncbi:MAG: hypothetical protein ABWZ82_03960 [Candidatus Limnocylindrales bacterium]
MTRLSLAVSLALSVALGLTVVMPGTAESPAPASPSVIDEVSVLIVQLRDPDEGTLSADRLEAAKTVIEARLEALPAADAAVTAIPGDRIRIDLAQPGQLEAVTRVATAPGELRILGIPDDRAADVVVGGPIPADMQVPVIVAPGHTANAAVGQDELGRPAVDLQLDAQAADAFDTWAADHFGGTIALVLDDVILSAATLQATAFEGHLQLSGSFDLPQIEELVAILSGGALPLLAEPLPACQPAVCPMPSASPGAAAVR